MSNQPSTPPPDPNDTGVCVERPAYQLPPASERLHTPSLCPLQGCEECRFVSDK